MRLENFPTLSVDLHLTNAIHSGLLKTKVKATHACKE